MTVFCKHASEALKKIGELGNKLGEENAPLYEKLGPYVEYEKVNECLDLMVKWANETTGKGLEFMRKGVIDETGMLEQFSMKLIKRSVLSQHMLEVIKILESCDCLDTLAKSVSEKYVYAESYNNLESRHDELEKNHEILKEGNQKLKEIHDELDRNHNKLQEQYKQLKKESDELGKIHDNLKEKCKNLEQKNDDLIDERKELEEKNNQEKEKYNREKLNQEKEKGERLVESAKKNEQLKNSNNKNAELAKNLEDTKKKLDESEKQVGELNNQLTDLRIESNNKETELQTKIKEKDDELRRKDEEIELLKNRAGLSEEELLNEKLRWEKKNLELFAIELKVSLEQINSLSRYHEKLNDAQKRHNQDKVITHEDDIARIKQELLEKEISIVNIQEICQKCERIAELRWELEQMQQQYQAQQEVPTK